jgi:RNA polymerase subunit RPABC4/transcription elongation factor Spt4
MTAAIDVGQEWKKKCMVCDREIPATATKCPVCRSEPDGDPCINCRKLIPKGARLCSICKTYQPWWKFVFEIAAALPVVAILALASGIWTAGTYLYDRNSHTDFKFVSANANVIFLAVWNTGQKPSAILGGRLHFAGLPIDDVDLLVPEVDVQEGTMVIKKGDGGRVALTVPPFQGLRNRGQTYSKDDIQGLLTTHQITLYLTVNESDGDIVRPHDTFTADRIQAFISGRLYK